MYCKNCGKEINENTKFCPFCGTTVNENSEIVEGNNELNNVNPNGIVNNNEPITSNVQNNNLNEINTYQNSSDVVENTNLNSVNSNGIVNNSVPITSNIQNSNLNEQPIANAVNNNQVMSSNSNLNKGKNNNVLFLIIVIILVLIIIGLGMFIGFKLVSNKNNDVVNSSNDTTEKTETVKKVDQTTTFSLGGYVFKLPKGYKLSLENGINLVMDDEKEAVFSFEQIKNENFNDYLNSAEEIKSSLISTYGYNVQNYEQKNIGGMLFLVFKILYNDKECYLYVAKLDSYNVVSGSFVLASYTTVDSALEKLEIIISSATGDTKNTTTTFSKTLPHIQENNTLKSNLK